MIAKPIEKPVNVRITVNRVVRVFVSDPETTFQTRASAPATKPPPSPVIVVLNAVTIVVMIVSKVGFTSY